MFPTCTLTGEESMSLETRKIESLQLDHEGMAFSLLCNRFDLNSSLRKYLYIFSPLLLVFQRSKFFSKFRGRNYFKGGRLLHLTPVCF